MSFDCELTWINAPALNDKEEEIIQAFPILLPSNLVSRSYGVYTCKFFNIGCHLNPHIKPMCLTPQPKNPLNPQP